MSDYPRQRKSDSLGHKVLVGVVLACVVGALTWVFVTVRTTEISTALNQSRIVAHDDRLKDVSVLLRETAATLERVQRNVAVLEERTAKR